MAAKIIGGIGLGGWSTVGVCATAGQFDFRIGPGLLVDQLTQLEDVTRLEVVFDEDAQKGVRTKGVHGRHSVEDGLIILLRPTGFTCEYIGAAVSIRPAPRHHTPKRCLRPHSAASEELPPEPKPQTSRNIAEVSIYSDKTGSHLKDGLQIGAVVLTLDAQGIRESGALDAGDLLRQYTQNFNGGATQDTRGNAPEAFANSGLGDAPNLRGAGSHATLMLINGLPTAPSGSDASFYDVLGIPLAAIKQLDVLPDGAAAIYGSGVGGVINVHLLDQYTGAETHLEIGSQQQYRLSHLGGFRWDGGDFLAVAEFAHWDAIPTSARVQGNAYVVSPNLNGEAPFSNPGNLQTSNGAIYPIPYVQSGQPLDFATLQPGAPHLTNPWSGADIVPDQTRWSLFTTFHHNLASAVSLWSDVLYSQRRANQYWGGQEVDLDVENSPFLLHAPPGPITETYSLLDDLGSRRSSAYVQTLHATVGLQITLPGSWRMVLRGANAAERESQLNTGQADVNQLQTYVDSGVFNPFAAGGSDSSVGTAQWYTSLSQLWTYQVVADGPSFWLPAGPWHGALGIELHDQGFKSRDQAGDEDLRREGVATFLELEGPLLPELSISLAGRCETYSDLRRSAAVPRIGFQWAPYEQLKLRGTWGISVRPPLLGDVSEAANTSVLDPRQNIIIWSGGNSQLKVERATTGTFGVEFQAEGSVAHLKTQLGYFAMRYHDRIDQPVLESNFLTDPRYASFVIYHPDLSMLERVCDYSTFSGGTRQDCLQQQVDAVVDVRLQNLDTLWTDGIDAQTQLSVDSPYGTWGAGLTGTYVLDYAQSQTPQSPLVALLNQESEPLSLHLIATASWQRGPVKAIVTVSHTGHYLDTETNPATRVGAWTTTNLRLSYTFGTDDHTKWEIAGQCQNVFNQLPPYSIDVVDDRGFDAENSDETGRSCTASIHLTWLPQ